MFFFEVVVSFVWFLGFLVFGVCWKGGEVLELGFWVVFEVIGNFLVFEF